jgi:hypothetical protein
MLFDLSTKLYKNVSVIMDNCISSVSTVHKLFEPTNLKFMQYMCIYAFRRVNVYDHKNLLDMAENEIR